MMFNIYYYEIVKKNPTYLRNQEKNFFGEYTSMKTKVTHEYERVMRYICDVLSNDPFYNQNQLAVINDTIDEIKSNLNIGNYVGAGEFIICLQALLGLQIKLTGILTDFIIADKKIDQYIDVAFFDGTCFLDDDFNNDDIKQII